MKCRHCDTELAHTLLDLGYAPPSNAYLSAKDLACPETYYPLKVRVCHECWLVQTEDYAEAGELFNDDYAYFSSTSTGWLTHSKIYAQRMIEELDLCSDSLVIEVASNDGYLLKNFIAADIPCLGIEPTASTAEAAKKIGVPVLQEFFGEAVARQLAKKGQQADLIAGNNVYAHVPDINDFTRGLKEALKPGGVITLEFPHLMRLLKSDQFDTVYHEHFSYLSLYTVKRIFESVGLNIWKVEELGTHGGSLRIYGCHQSDTREISKTVATILDTERTLGLQELAVYESFQERANLIKDDLLRFLLEQKQLGKTVLAYGAAAKGNTLLNYAGVKPDLVPYVVDAAKAKQGKYMPGSHIPILAPEAVTDMTPDYLLVLPWNIKKEVAATNIAMLERGTKVVTAVPRLEIL
jgi:SAM-dependent methyltransferase